MPVRPAARTPLLAVLLGCAMLVACQAPPGAQSSAIGQCYMMDGLGWTKPLGPIERIVADPRHGRPAYFATGPDGAEFYLTPEAGRVVPCADSAAGNPDAARTPVP